MNSRYSAIYHSIHSHIVAKLQQGLSPRYTYHSLGHTLDVLEQTQQIATREGITNEQDLFLLKVAALYHDTGFLFVYAGHEQKGCELGIEELPGFGLTPPQIKKICGLIMATKIPQSPKTKLEQIICDADLDYLGRDDFEPISNSLYKEFLDFGFVKDHIDWMQKQIGFLEYHRYFTKSSQQLRQPKKTAQLLKLKATNLPGDQ
ncbi:MAG: HD domain-containing protein [Chitinophagaceae bacterium]|nr:HD domain-containing protein [Chitinophagaceae bacterium]